MQRFIGKCTRCNVRVHALIPANTNEQELSRTDILSILKWDYVRESDAFICDGKHAMKGRRH